MANLIIDDALAARLKQLAEQENRPVNAVLENLLDRYVLEPTIPNNITEVQLNANQELRAKLYAMARDYWRQVGDQEHLTLTDEQLDGVFWMIDLDGIPRFKSEQGKIERRGTLAHMTAIALQESTIDVHDTDIAAHSREILQSEYADYLLKRMSKSDDQGNA